ncbi:MAG: 4-hydroxy-tetrahydrodipicolinate synthase [Bacteroidetes bacterium]|nr:4-hydroxy-tetrahydrodipicolinate synthase [Bacteroidia bacterium]PCH66615.1 MAG: 4-hydroxy-tetrahydrodipicolinate synthase [Bacteroidota bacterium]
MQDKFGGTGVALVTPFRKDGSIDFRSYDILIEKVIKGRVNYLVVLGTTGEAVTLSKEERLAVLEFVIEVNNKRLPIVVGAGGYNTQEVINFLREFHLDDIDGILSVTPYYNKPSQEGLYMHYKAIADASPLPVILYNVPGRTSVNLTADTTLRLARDFRNIVGIKEASGNVQQCMDIIRDKPRNFVVLSGDDALTLPLIACGMDGVISVVANAFPRNFSRMVRNALDGDFDKAKKLHYKLLDVIELLFVEGNPAGIKAALRAMEITSDKLRLPLVNVSRSTYNRIAEEITKF